MTDSRVHSSNKNQSTSSRKDASSVKLNASKYVNNQNSIESSANTQNTMQPEPSHRSQVKDTLKPSVTTINHASSSQRPSFVPRNKDKSVDIPAPGFWRDMHFKLRPLIDDNEHMVASVQQFFGLSHTGEFKSPFWHYTFQAAAGLGNEIFRKSTYGNNINHMFILFFSVFYFHPLMLSTLIHF